MNKTYVIITVIVVKNDILRHLAVTPGSLCPTKGKGWRCETKLHQTCNALSIEALFETATCCRVLDIMKVQGCFDGGVFVNFTDGLSPFHGFRTAYKTTLLIEVSILLRGNCLKSRATRKQNAFESFLRLLHI